MNKLLAAADKLVALRRNPFRVLLDQHPDNNELEQLLLGRDDNGWRYPCGVVIETLIEAGMIDPRTVNESHLRHFRTSRRRGSS